MPTHKDYEDRITEALDSLINVPKRRGEDAVSHVILQYQLARMVLARAEKHAERLRAMVGTMTPWPQEMGTHTLHDSPYIMAAAVVKAPTRRLDAESVKMAFIERLDCDDDEADKLVEGCKVNGTSQTQVTVLIKK